MKRLALAEVIVVNAILISLLVLITQNYASRMAYWARPGDEFTPTMTRYPLFFITSAVKGSTRIPGILSVDWQQVIVLVLVVVDGLFILSALKSRSRKVAPTP
jgi:hypothetical protein